MLPPENVHRPYRHKQGKGGIESPGQRDYGTRGMGSLHPLRKAPRLDLQDPRAHRRLLCRTARNKRMAVDFAGQLRFPCGQGERDGRIRGIVCGKGIHPAAVVRKMGEIHHRRHQLRSPERRVFRKDRPVCRDHGVTGEHNVRRRFPAARVGIHIRGHESARRALHEHPAIRVLPDGFIGRGEIAQHRRPRRRKARSRCIRHPQILADLAAEDKIRHIFARKQEPSPKRHGLAAQGDRSVFARCRRELAQLVKFRVIRDVRLRHHAEDPSVQADRRAVVRFSVPDHRDPDERDHRHPHRPGKDLCKRLLRVPDELVCEKQVAAGVSGDGKLRERDDLRAGRRRLFHQPHDLCAVVCRIRDRSLRDRGGKGDKSILHWLDSFFILRMLCIHRFLRRKARIYWLSGAETTGKQRHPKLSA